MGKSSLFVAKVIFGICNLLFLVMGVAMIVVGAYFQISQSNYIDLMPSDEFFIATALLIASGTIVVVLCLFGFIGMWMNSQCILAIYSLCVLIILALSLASGIMAYVFHNDIDEKLESKLYEGLRSDDRKTFWDNVQNEERCCGVRNYTDWYGIEDTDFQTRIPDSCCDGPNCGQQGAAVAYDIGCYEKGKDLVKDNFYKIAVAGIVLGVLQLILVAASLWLVASIRRDRTV